MEDVGPAARAAVSTVATAAPEAPIAGASSGARHMVGARRLAEAARCRGFPEPCGRRRSARSIRRPPPRPGDREPDSGRDRQDRPLARAAADRPSQVEDPPAEASAHATGVRGGDTKPIASRVTAAQRMRDVPEKPCPRLECFADVSPRHSQTAKLAEEVRLGHAVPEVLPRHRKHALAITQPDHGARFEDGAEPGELGTPRELDIRSSEAKRLIPPDLMCNIRPHTTVAARYVRKESVA